MEISESQKRMLSFAWLCTVTACACILMLAATAKVAVWVAT